MPFPVADTEITYPDGDTASVGRVLHVEAMPDGRSAVLLDRTAFHPVDTAWPDQPSDRGTIRWAGGEAAVVGGLVGGIHEDRFLLGPELPVRTGTPDWVFVVAHVIEGTAPAVGEEVRVEVDAEHRAALSAGHTACHLASLALDDALAGSWTKEVPLDGRGRPAFDSLAIQRSRIVPGGSVDTYRVGKSLRKRGFDPGGFADPAALAARVDAQLDAWTARGAAVRIDRAGAGLSDRRSWVCSLPDGAVTIPCGGTHVTDIAAVAGAAVRLAVEAQPGALEIEMTTTVPAAHGR